MPVVCRNCSSAFDLKHNYPFIGIPEFWLTIFKNVDMLQEMVQEHDEPALAALQDVKVTFSDGSNPNHPMVSVQ